MTYEELGREEKAGLIDKAMAFLIGSKMASWIFAGLASGLKTLITVVAIIKIFGVAGTGAGATAAAGGVIATAGLAIGAAFAAAILGALSVGLGIGIGKALEPTITSLKEKYPWIVPEIPEWAKEKGLTPAEMRAQTLFGMPPREKPLSPEGLGLDQTIVKLEELEAEDRRMGFTIWPVDRPALTAEDYIDQLEQRLLGLEDDRKSRIEVISYSVRDRQEPFETALDRLLRKMGELTEDESKIITIKYAMNPTGVMKSIISAVMLCTKAAIRR